LIVIAFGSWVEGWEWILRGALGYEQNSPNWFDLPAMMRFTITTPNVLRTLQANQVHLQYRDRAKPWNFVQSPLISEVGGHPVDVNPNKFTLIKPFQSDPSKWQGTDYLNIHDGKTYRLARPGRRLPSEVEPKTYGDYLGRYRWHPEAKSLAPDGTPCGQGTNGLLKRMPVVASAHFAYIGKETDRRWEQGEDISILDSTVTEYRPNESEKMVVDRELQESCRLVSIRALARAAGVSENTVKAARRGERLQKSTIGKLVSGVKHFLEKGSVD
jgi:hypothetical protein